MLMLNPPWKDTKDLGAEDSQLLSLPTAVTGKQADLE